MIDRPRILVIHHTAIEDDVQLPIIEKSHAGRGYPSSELDEDSHVCYHFIVGRDATVKQLRSLSERAGCTRNQPVNLEAIQIVVAGNFDKEPPSQAQLVALRNLITRLDTVFHFERIEGHRHASPTACPGKHLLEALADVWRNPEASPKFMISRYYTPVPGQTTYYHGSYEKDFKINCQGDCLKTADGFTLAPRDAYKVAACPPEMPFGQKLDIEGIGIVTCHDHGGAIKKNRIDVWAGIGDDGLRNIYNKEGGLRSVKIL